MADGIVDGAWGKVGSEDGITEEEGGIDGSNKLGFNEGTSVGLTEGILGTTLDKIFVTLLGSKFDEYGR